ncbi:IPT/TIG domain-containing protein [uncultured Bacteroides sp.]|jgi:IPT/TIG domain protein|uniref:IPT/TIG domain-containing protein n=1 Tax=uncultured Bacteroides sp. TaxID=162156 RepID=UPI00280A716E|nr:IPT/TIG domain-containing protein [uncultured Bacteroides sp.]
MNKLYYLLFLLSLVLLVACEEEGPEVVNIKNQDPVITATMISPTQGYVGEQFTITGTEFGGSMDFTKVFIGDFQCNIISCSDVKIVVEVPEEAVTGKVFLDILGQRISTEQVFTVLDYPVLSTDELSGYKNGELTITGNSMPADIEYLTVKFGDITAEITSYTVDEEGNGTMTVEIPATLPVGTVKLVVMLLDTEVYNKNFTVLPSPTVDYRENWFTRAGHTIVLTGTGFSGFEDKIEVDFNGISVVPNSADVSANRIAVQVPDEFEGGKVSVEFEGFPKVEAGELRMLNAGEITNTVLKNSVQPFEYTGAQEDDWAVPTGWSFNEAYGGDYALHFPAVEPDGLLAMQAGWGLMEKNNAKMYQVVTLPAGNYTFELQVAECGTQGGDFGVMFAVTAGNATIPNLIKSNGIWVLADESNVFASYRVTDDKVDGASKDNYHTETVTMTLTEDTEVTIGFVAQLTDKSYAKLSYIKVTLE